MRYDGVYCDLPYLIVYKVGLRCSCKVSAIGNAR